MKPPLTCLVGTYNEAARLPAFLKHATQWADEVVVVDKSSTDTTREIARAAGARVFTTAWSPQGHEDKHEQFGFCTNAWVFLMTPGEIPTRGLVEAVSAALAEHGDTAAIITIPKKLYSFGIHHPASPWSIGQQPMLVNKRKAVISNRVHKNFSLPPGGIVVNIPWSETCHVYHPTHATVQGFLSSHFDYILAEAEGTNAMELREEAMRNLIAHDFNAHDPVLFGQECAWKIYWLGCCLAAWEKVRNRNVPEEYRAQTEAMIAREWTN